MANPLAKAVQCAFADIKDDVESEAGAPSRVSVSLDSTVDGETCAVCLEPKQDTEKVSSIHPCEHSFHEHCMEELFKNCFVRECPLCRGEITFVMHSNGRRQELTDLRSRFRQRCYDISFRSDPLPFISEPAAPATSIESYFTVPEQICAAPVEERHARDGSVFFRGRIPFVVLEMLDSDGALEESHSEPVSVHILHSDQNGPVSLTPDTAVMHGGRVIFRNIEVCMGRPGVVALKFVAQAPGLPVHRKCLFAAVDFRHSNSLWAGRVLALSICLGLCLAALLAAAVASA